jgi:membrane protein DedA with SNARE-associated domain
MTSPVAGAIDRPSLSLRRSMLGLAAALYVTGTIGSNIAFAWMRDRPAAVLALSSRNRNLLASVPFINPVAYAVIGFSRVLLVAVVLYLVGRWFGPRTLGWVENQLGELPSIYHWAQRAMDRAGWLVVVVMPGSNLVCLLAGHRRMEVRRFVTAAAAGTILKLVVLWIGGRIFEDQIKAFFDFIDGYQWWLVAAAFAVTFAQAGWRARKRSATISPLGSPPSDLDVVSAVQEAEPAGDAT